MTIALALMSSALWGTADFFGGRASRTLPVVAVLAWVQGTGLLLAIALTLVVAPDMSAEGVAWSAVAGVVGGVAIGLFYAALAAGAMSLVAPLAACGAVIPATVAIAGGEDPTTVVLIGLVLALGGAALVAREPADENAHVLSSRALLLAVGSAVSIGALLALFQHASELEGSSALATVLVARAAALPLTLAVVVARRVPLRTGDDPASAAPLVAAGLFDTGANALFAIASTKGSDAIAAVLGSLYPVMTVVLAAALLHERVHRAQALGIAVALAGVVLVSAG